MNLPSIALTTATRLPDGMEDTRGLLAALRARGARADLVVWSDPAVAWDGYDRVLLHAPWDYSEHLTAFDAWLEKVVGERLVNPLPLMRWNADKRYLNELAAQGVPVPATVTVTDPARVEPEALTAELGTGPLVVKATVGAGGRSTWLLDDAVAARDFLRLRVPVPGPFLVQAFIPTVQETGEYSAIQIGGRLSHVVRKVPARDEFRVQHHYGGTVHAESIQPWMDDFVLKVGNALPDTPQYARIDFVLSDGNTPVLMEAEVIEPDLFLRYDEGAYDAFAGALTSA